MTIQIKKGAATLAAILLISGIVMELAISGLIVGVLVSNTVASSKLAAQALVAARTGAEDAAVKIVRYKNCSALATAFSITCDGVTTYPLTVDTASATVGVIDNADGTLKVVSIGNAGTRKKRFEAVMGVDAFSGQIIVISMQEKPF
ncbi:MAG: hypothetical protein AAB659_01005 [Patescibacteria group bacterium]